MFEYSSLFNSSVGEQVRNTLYDLVNFAKGIPYYGYALALVVFYLVARLLIKKT